MSDKDAIVVRKIGWSEDLGPPTVAIWRGCMGFGWLA
jgi:hypothetical protein